MSRASRVAGVTLALGDLTWPQAQRLAAAEAMLAVSVGSTEQHGPHLPLSTDTDVAVALAASESVDALLWMAGDEPAGARSRRSISSAPARLMLGLNGRRRTPTGDAHAGRTETAIQLAVDPDRVRMSRAEAGNRTPIAELMPLLQAAGVRAASRNGVLGDPSGASAAEGAELLAALTADLVAAVAAWRGPGPG